MKVVVLSYTGFAGKTTVTTHLLAPRIPGAKIFAVETINETAGDIGLDVEQIKGERFGQLFRQLLREPQAIVDVGGSNIEDFIDEMVKHEDSHLDFDFFLVPVVSTNRAQKECLQTVNALHAAGIAPEKIRIVFNKVDSSVQEEFAPVLGYAKTSKSCIANPAVAIYENEVFDMIGAKKLTISSLLEDTTDYRAALKALGPDGDDKKASHYTDMIALQALAKPVKRQLDAVFDVLFK